MKPIMPMKADVMPDGFQPTNHIIEQKYDGHRMMIHVSPGNKIYSWSSTGKPSNRKLSDELYVDVVMNMVPGVYDGELHLIKPTMSSSDVAKLDNKNKLCFTAFDVLCYYEDKILINICHLALSQRKYMLQNMVMGTSRISFAPFIEVINTAQIQKFINDMFEQGYEGAIIKDLESRYEPGRRRRSWLKVKQCKHIEMMIYNYEPPEIHTEYGTLYLKSDDGNVLTSVKVPNLKLRDLFLNEGMQYGRKVMIEYQDVTHTGALRHPRFDRFADE